ncbi:MAG: helix-hairpin-helix domain-containing protein [Halanaerobiaceae bacterium]
MYSDNKKLILSGIIIFIILAVGSGFFFGGSRREGEQLAADSGEELEITDLDRDNDKQEKKIYVHLAGEVKNPGVVKVEEDSRVFDVLEAAGGKTRQADLSMINLAKPVYDGEKIEIPARVSEEDLSASNRKKVENMEEKKININNARKEELQELNGIGPSKAESIVDYREEIDHFSDPEELLEVNGIGEKTLEKIEDDLTVW